MEKTYYIEAARHEKNEYRVESSRFADEEYEYDELPAYEQMVKWMKEQLQLAENGKAKVQKFTPEYNPERDMNIIDRETTLTGPHYRVIPDNEIILDADEPFRDIKPALPYEAKGYDLGEDAYFFATVDTWRTVKPYKAESPEQALQMAKGDQLHNVLTRVQPTRQFLHANKFEKVTLEDGTVVNVVSEEDFQQKLKEKFPEGLTIRLSDESFKNLLEYKNKCDDDVTYHEDWMGLGNPGNNAMLRACGSIPAELRLPPEGYKHIYACEETYYNELFLNLIGDEGITAPSLLMSEERGLDAFRVKVPKTLYMMDKLFINGKPFLQVMEMAEANRVKDDKGLHYMFDQEYLNFQPEWIKNLANEQTVPQRHKAWVNLTAKATSEFSQAQTRLMNECAEKFGQDTVKNLKKYMENQFDVPDKQVDKFINALMFLNGKMQPYQQAQDKAYQLYNYAKASFEADFARKLNDFIDRKVTDVTMYPDRRGNWNVRCKINGEQQMGRPITDSDAKIRRGSTIRSVKEMASKYYAKEIVLAMDEGLQLQKGLKR